MLLVALRQHMGDETALEVSRRCSRTHSLQTSSLDATLTHIHVSAAISCQQTATPSTVLWQEDSATHLSSVCNCLKPTKSPDTHTHTQQADTKAQVYISPLSWRQLL